MKDTIELEISPDGTVRTIYSDEVHAFAEELGFTISKIQRASNVEWEEIEALAEGWDRKVEGWTVRAAHRPSLAIRYARQDRSPSPVMEVSETGPIVVFKSREEALKFEVRHFWKLLPPEGSKK